MQAHPSASKQERKTLCRLMDSRKLSPDASLHAAQNERLPVRAVIQVLFSEQTKLSRQIDWSGSFSSTRSPNPAASGLEQQARCMSKREMAAQQIEIRRLKEEVMRLQSQCNSMQSHIERLLEKNKKGGSGLFKWRKFGIMPSFKNSVKIEEGYEEENGFGRQTPMLKAKLVRRTPPKWRKSMS